ncbi:MAG TPA: hypothetical protein VFI61_03230 [Patescibacteria group bacterium]|nr:hypothetical protein [Patescibacteria group bacterium]
MPDPNQTDPNQNTTTPPVAAPSSPVVPLIPNSPTVQQPAEVPSFLHHTDLPPLPPDFQNTEQPGVPAEASAKAGSAAPQNLPKDSFPTMVSATPKKKFGGGKIIATILGLFLLIGGVAGGVILTQQDQNISEKAVGIGACACKSDQGATINGTCLSNGGCGCPSGYNEGTNRCSERAQDDNGNATTTIVSCGASGAKQCGVTPSGCGGFCILPVDKTCDDMLRQECNFEPVRGANYVEVGSKDACPSGFQSAECPCATSTKGKVCFDRGFSTQCGGTDGLCAVFSNSQTSGGAGGAACGTVSTYYCVGSQDTSGGCQQNLNNRPTNFCGTIQTDTACQGFKTTVVPCTSGGEETTTLTAQCQNIKAYSATWTALTAAQLSALAPTTAVNFCVVGSASDGSAFDKAKFTINGVAQTETTTKRPTTQDFCQAYTIPAAVTTFNISAQIHHVTLGYK